VGTSAGNLGRIQSRLEEHRLFLRKRILQPFSIELSPGKKALLYDLSEGGLRVYGGSGLDLGTSAYVRFQFPEANTVIDAFGVVAWSDPSGRAGIRFTHMQPESTAGLRRWLESESTTADAVAATASKDDSVLASRISSLAQVSDLQAKISSCQLDREAALDLIVRRMMEVTRASGAAIALREADDVVCRASVGNAPDVGVKLSSSSLSGECFRTGTVVLLSDSETDSRVDPEVCRQLNFRSLLVLPITAGEESIGIAEVLSPNPRNFEGGDILVVSFLAEMIVSCTDPPKQIAQPELLDVASLLSVGEPIAPPEAAIAESMAGSPATVEPTGNGLNVASVSFLAPILASEEPDSIPIPELPVPVVAAPLTVIAEALPHAVAEQPALPGPIQATVAAPANVPLERALEAAVEGTSTAVTPMAKPQVDPALVPEAAVLSPAAKLMPATPVSIAETKPPLFSMPEPQKLSWTLALATAIVGLLVSAGLLFNYHRHNGTASPAPTATAPTAAKPVANSAPPPMIAPTPSPANDLIAFKPITFPGTRLPALPLKPRSNESAGDELSVIHAAASSRPVLEPDGPVPEAPTIALADSGLGALPAGVTAAAPKPNLQVSQSQGVIPGRLLKKVAPLYPDLALNAGVSGDVVLLAVIGTDGRLHHLKAVSGNPMLREEAVAAARQWRYAPATLSGKPVASDTRITINFTINPRR